MVEFKSEESVFNFAVDYLKGISNGLKMCEQCAAMGNAEGWVSWLRIVFRQLSAKTNDKEDDDFNKDFQRINGLINNPETRKTKRNTIFWLLDMLESKLRKTLQKKGMLLPGKENPYAAVTKR